jgi:hypothetical protein
MPICATLSTPSIQRVELGLVNGAEGLFHGVMFDEDTAPDLLPGTVNDPVFLDRLPAALLMRFPDATFQLEGLPQGVAPIFPISTSFEHASPGYRTMKIKRRSFPVTNAFAITDYNAQGRTMQHLIVDLRPPPDGKISFANTYVPLSRPREGKNLRILTAFPMNPVLRWQPPPAIARDEKWQRTLERQHYTMLISQGYDVTFPPTDSTPPTALPFPCAPDTLVLPVPLVVDIPLLVQFALPSPPIAAPVPVSPKTCSSNSPHVISNLISS